MRFDKTLIGALVCALHWAGVQAAPQKASFTSDVSSTQWPLAAFDPNLPIDWTGTEFLVVELRS